MGDGASDLDFLARGGDMGARIRAHDWAGTSFGPAETWPLPLRTLTRLMLAANQPMFIGWGDDNRLLYNDAYAEILAGKHPALGKPLLEVWSEISGELRPIAERTRAGIPVHMDEIRFHMHRRGYREETFFSFSYTPIHDDSGRTAGLFCACNETTRQVHLQRALAQSEARASRLLESVADGFIALEPGWRIAFLNRRGQEMLAPLTPCGGEGFVGMDFWEAFPDVAGSPFEAVYRAAMERRETGNVEAYFAPLDTWFDLRAYPTGDGICGLFLDVGERKRAEHHRELLIHELDHRVKNTLAIVQAIASQTFRTVEDREAAREVFQRRLGALAAAHNLLTLSGQERVPMAVLARQIVDSACARPESVSMSGPELVLNDKAAITLAMALHELCTNALKHGALSGEAGRVLLHWEVTPPDGFQLSWREAGGPQVQPPANGGFGLKMIRQALGQEFAGETELDFRPDGFQATLRGRLPQR